MPDIEKAGLRLKLPRVNTKWCGKINWQPQFGHYNIEVWTEQTAELIKRMRTEPTLKSTGDIQTSSQGKALALGGTIQWRIRPSLMWMI